MADPPDIAEKLARQSHLVLRVDVRTAFSGNALRDRFDPVAVADWLDGLGVRDVTALAIFRCGDRYQLHVAELAPGRPVDFATGQPVTAPRVIELGTDPTWPECLNIDAFKPARVEFIAPMPEPEPAAV